METMHKAGLLVDSDLLSAKVFVSQMRDRQIRAQDDLALAEMQLAREMGFQGLAISLMAGEVASTFLSRMAVPVLYYMSERGGK
jgi:outer membrane protein TolC